jgi:hypothetical protein
MAQRQHRRRILLRRQRLNRQQRQGGQELAGFH